ncbi:helix-turn-helix transcriptional regulator [Roseburia hominis]
MNKNEAVKKCVASNLKKCRKKCGMTMEEVAKEIGVTRQCIGMYENSARIPRMDRLLRILNLYGTTLEELVDDGKKEEEPPAEIEEDENE